MIARRQHKVLLARWTACFEEVTQTLSQGYDPIIWFCVMSAARGDGQNFNALIGALRLLTYDEAVSDLMDAFPSVKDLITELNEFYDISDEMVASYKTEVVIIDDVAQKHACFWQALNSSGATPKQILELRSLDVNNTIDGVQVYEVIKATIALSNILSEATSVVELWHLVLQDIFLSYL